MDLVKTHLAHQTDYVTFELDEYRTKDGEQILLAHLKVLRWSPATLRAIRSDWDTFRQAVTCPLFALPMHEDEKWRRFVTSMGWRPTGQHVLCHDGELRPLYIHTISDPNTAGQGPREGSQVQREASRDDPRASARA